MNYINIKDVFSEKICPICNKQIWFGECSSPWSQQGNIKHYYSNLGGGGILFYLDVYTFNTFLFSKNSGHFKILKGLYEIYSDDFVFSNVQDIINLANKTLNNFKNNEVFL